MAPTGLLVFLAIVLVLGGAILLGFVLRDKTPKLHKEKYQEQWLRVERMLKKDEPSSYQLAILEADKLLDKALKESKVKGDTMGARLKQARVLLQNNNAVWSAHKIRNQIAHETDVVISYDSARRALAAFKNGLKDLGAI